MTGLRKKFEDQYPTAKEIREILDDDVLQGYLDEVTLDISHLETRLEFLYEEDVPHERGLKNKLSYARNTVKAIEAHRRFLKGPESLTEADKQKTERLRERERVDAINARKKLIKSISWHVLFVRIARERVSKELLSEILDATDEEYLKKVEEESSRELSHPGESES